jgi:predicted transcriptional regulator
VAGQLPIEVEEFIFNYIDSLEQLEILLLLSSSPERIWSSEEVNERIKSSSSSIAQRLEKLTAHGLVRIRQQEPLQYQYEPNRPELATAVQNLAAAYKERRLKVVQCIFSKPLSSLRIFADSFKIRKDPKDG